MSKPLFVLIVASLLPALTGGCSMAIANAGKDVSSRLSGGATRSRVEKLVGRPTREEAFPAGAAPTTQMADGAAVRVSRYAEYRFKGRADDLIEFEDLGMLVGLTLGFGEIVAFPMAIERSHQLQDRVHEYRVWYDANDRCVAYRLGQSD